MWLNYSQIGYFNVLIEEKNVTLFYKCPSLNNFHIVVSNFAPSDCVEMHICKGARLQNSILHVICIKINTN